MPAENFATETYQGMWESDGVKNGWQIGSSYDFSSRTVDCVWEQGSGAIGEDVLLIHDNIFGVFDGASSIDGRLFIDGTSGGLLAARQAAEVFKLNQGSLLDLAGKANQVIRNHMSVFSVDLQSKRNLWSTSMAVVRVEDGYFDWCQTGDCLILVIQRDGSIRMLVDDPQQDEETFAEWRKLNPASNENIVELLKHKIVQVREKVNVEYGSLNGEDSALNFIKHGRESLDQVADIVLYTDGLALPSPHNNSSDEDLEQFVSLYQRGGVRCILEHVRSLQRNDATCRLYPRFKIHDDAAAIAITFSDTSHENSSSSQSMP